MNMRVFYFENSYKKKLIKECKNQCSCYFILYFSVKKQKKFFSIQQFQVKRLTKFDIRVRLRRCLPYERRCRRSSIIRVTLYLRLKKNHSLFVNKLNLLRMKKCSLIESRKFLFQPQYCFCLNYFSIVSFS